MSTTLSWIAWAAGLFEGEGCITQSKGRANVRIAMTDLWVLERFAAVVETETIYGPYVNGYRDGYVRKPRWVWASPLPGAQAVIEILEPWLSPRRVRRAGELGLLE